MGLIPSKLRANEYLMNIVSLFGAGLLVGAALIVIVPEGVSVLYEALESKHHEVINRYVGASLIFGFIMMLIIDQSFSSHEHSHEEDCSDTKQFGPNT